MNNSCDLRGGARILGRLLITVSLVIALATTSLAEPMEFRGKALKTAPAQGQAIEPLRGAIFDFDESGESRGGPPNDAKDRIGRMRSAAPKAKTEIRNFVRGLEKNGETEAFDQMVADRVADVAPPEAAAELEKQGGGTAMLKQADRIIDEMIADRGQAAGMGSALRLDGWELLGISSAHAGLRSGTCALFWYTVSFGYGTAHAYRSCYY
jgi:hypothetical protein